MKKLFYMAVLCLILAGCSKEESPDIAMNTSDKIERKSLGESEKILRDNLAEAARIIASLAAEDAIVSELKAISAEKRSSYELSFRELIEVTGKGEASSFNNLRERFLQECYKKGSTGGKPGLADYLADNDCYIYCPYPDNFYPQGTNGITVAAHPIDNEYEGKGYRFGNSGGMTEVMVNEEYADKNQVLLIMPKDPDKEDEQGNYNEKGSGGTKGDPVYEVKIGYVRCANYCGGLFEGTLELRISRGYGIINPQNETVAGTFSTYIPISYPREYARAAINNWTVASNGGWYPVFTLWDSNWTPDKVSQAILAYEFDKTISITASINVGFKLGPLSATQTVTATTTYSGDFLGLNEWNREWFFRTNTNPGPYDTMKDGWVVRTLSPVFKLTTPARIIQ